MGFGLGLSYPQCGKLWLGLPLVALGIFFYVVAASGGGQGEILTFHIFHAISAFPLIVVGALLTLWSLSRPLAIILALLVAILAYRFSSAILMLYN
jgi:hypothetical protein